MYTNDDLANLSDDDKKRQRNSIEMQRVMLESDNRKFLEEKNILEAEERKIRKDIERLRVNLEEKRKELGETERKIAESDEELKKLKAKLNAL